MTFNRALPFHLPARQSSATCFRSLLQLLLPWPSPCFHPHRGPVPCLDDATPPSLPAPPPRPKKKSAYENQLMSAYLSQKQNHKHPWSPGSHQDAAAPQPCPYLYPCWYLPPKRGFKLTVAVTAHSFMFGHEDVPQDCPAITATDEPLFGLIAPAGEWFIAGLSLGTLLNRLPLPWSRASQECKAGLCNPKVTSKHSKQPSPSPDT